MEEIIKILMTRDGIDYEIAKALCEEAMDETVENPGGSAEIMMDYLGLEPDYIETLFGD